MEKGLTLSPGRFSLLRASQTSKPHRLLPQLLPQHSRGMCLHPSAIGRRVKDTEYFKTNEQTSNLLQPLLIHPPRGFLSDILNASQRLRNGDARSGIVRSWRRQKCPMLPQRICAFYTCFLHMFLFHNVIYNPIFQMCHEV